LSRARNLHEFRFIRDGRSDLGRRRSIGHRFGAKPIELLLPEWSITKATSVDLDAAMIDSQPPRLYPHKADLRGSMSKSVNARTCGADGSISHSAIAIVRPSSE
jgi:hypothetical protein